MAASEARNTLRAAQAVYEKALVRLNPLAVVDLSPEGDCPPADNSIAQRGSDSFGAHVETSTTHHPQSNPVTGYGGHSNVGYDLVQSFPGEEPNCSGIPEHFTSRHEYHNADDSSLDNEQQPVVLTFPEGEADAVTIIERDMEGLRPTMFLSNNIIDFYIKYLERTLLSSEVRERFYFFNSFFFTKLLGNNNASTDMDQCKVDYEQVRKWSGGVNLFEKDYVFIPVLRSSHWSLIIICHLPTVCSSPGKGKGSPYVFHLDSSEGMHESFEDQVRSYLLKAWMERYKGANNMDDQLLSLFQTKYVQAKVPQQNNGHDCGLYLLHYVEVFLHESASPNFSFASSKGGPHFTSPQFTAEVSAKRMVIERIILDLHRRSKEQAAKHMEIQILTQELRRIQQKLLICLDGEDMSRGRSEIVRSNGIPKFDAQGDESKEAVPLSTRKMAMDNQHQQCLAENEHSDHPTNWKLALDNSPSDGAEVSHAEYQTTNEVASDRHLQPKRLQGSMLPGPSKPGTNKRGRNWTEKETSILLECKVEGGRYCKDNQGATRWEKISEEIMARLGTELSGDQCRLRYDTLLKAYNTSKNYSLKTGKSFSEISEEERREWKLAKTLMREDWYEAIDALCHRSPHKAKSQKRSKLSPSDGNDSVSLSPFIPATLSPPAPARASVPALISEPASIPTGSSKVENSPERQVVIPGMLTRMRFISLDENLRSTLLDLIQFSSKETWELRICGLEAACRRLAIVQDRQPSEIRGYIFRLSELKLVNVCEHGGREGVQCLENSELGVYTNPDFDTFLEMYGYRDSVAFPEEPLSGSLLQIRVLSLQRCFKLEHADLSHFPELRYLHIQECGELKAVTGWEVVQKLGWLEIRHCKTYVDFPPVQYLPSLREFYHNSSTYGLLEGSEMMLVPAFSQCVRLRSLEICGYNSLNSMDLSSLRSCDGLTTIQGLSGLQHSLTKLNLGGCSALRRVPELGWLKALTHLDMSWSGVQEIPGLEDLHLLTELHLDGCRSLKALPYLGHLKALTYLNISCSGVEEIPGAQDLHNLESLRCGGSKLKTLPDLRHLHRLRTQNVTIGGTPLSLTNPDYVKEYVRLKF
ncbi:hypothetical protein KC19_4G087500 [Ceratodon purpureus]|uniref:Ubiquitin-like protease family profile domain-containing protein n=1 Tax=Ceratodon purpureus TaxID=3225 RepID=A0A8T0I8F9_CERPU|nr:hypothetical protein KC19_4G087500 [Ceratodon purpureus]